MGRLGLRAGRGPDSGRWARTPILALAAGLAALLPALTATPAAATETPALTVTKELFFPDDPNAYAGENFFFRFRIKNNSASTITNISFTDDLSALDLALSDVQEGSCPGTGFNGSGSSPLTISGGTLAPGAECALPVIVTVNDDAAGGPRTNTTSAITGNSGDTVVEGPASSVQFTVRARPIVTIVKKTVGGDGEFEITAGFSDPPQFLLKTSGGTASRTFTGVGLGSYPLSELIPGGWEQTSVNCVDGENNSFGAISPDGKSITVNFSYPDAYDKEITCTFTNTRTPAEGTGSIVIRKQSIGGEGPFAFTGSLGSFNLNTTGGGADELQFFDLAPGIYSVTETANDDYTLIDIVCDGLSGTESIAQRVVNINLAENQTGLCTFINRKKATITVIKEVVGPDGTFAFGGDLGDFNLTTHNGPASQSFKVEPGDIDFEVFETGGTEYDLDIECTGAELTGEDDHGVKFDVIAGADITCTFTNTIARGRVTVVKNSEGGDGTFNFFNDFYVGDDGSFSIATSGGTGSESFVVDPGSYEIGEVLGALPEGFSLTGLTCTGGEAATSLPNGTASFTIAAGEHITCTFTNTRPVGSITIVKQQVGGTPGPFSFTTIGLSEFTLNTDTGPTSKTFTDLPAPGIYGVSESAPGYLVSIQCDKESLEPIFAASFGSVGIGLLPGEHITCTFTNTKIDAGIELAKEYSVEQTTGSTKVDLTFTIRNTGNAQLANVAFEDDIATALPDATIDATITTSGCGGNASTTIVPPAKLSVSGVSIVAGGACTITITINIPLGILPDAYLNTTTAVTATVAGTETTVEGDPASDTLTITGGTITIVKESVGVVGPFDFKSFGLTDFTLDTTNGPASQTFTDLPQGVYGVYETVPGYNVAIACQGQQTSEQIERIITDGYGSVAIALFAGQHITCTFTNTKNETTIRVIKEVVGGNGTFNFFNDFFVEDPGAFAIATANGMGLAEFTVPGGKRYEVGEVLGAMPEGFELTFIDCEGGLQTSVNYATGSASFDAVAQQTVTCTFTNTATFGTVTVIKNAIGGDGTFTFFHNFGTGGPDLTGTFPLTTVNGTASATFQVDPDTYYVVEFVRPPFALSGFDCTDSIGPVEGIGLAFQIVAAEAITCTFTNTAFGSITIAVATQGGDDFFDFSGTGGLGEFTIATLGGGGAEVFDDLAPGTYEFTADVHPAYILSNIVCSGDNDNGTNPEPSLNFVSVDLDAGEDILCVFEYDEALARTLGIIQQFMENRGGFMGDVGPNPDDFVNWFNGGGGGGQGAGAAGGTGTGGTGALPYFPVASIPTFAWDLLTAGSATLSGGTFLPGASSFIWNDFSFDSYGGGGPGAAYDGLVVKSQIGLTHVFSQRLLGGLMFEWDWAREDSLALAYSVSGLGFIAGPYGAVRLADNLYFDGKLLLGRSWNRISPFLTYTDIFLTNRLMATARLFGVVAPGNWTIRPTVKLFYFRERQLAYVDFNGIAIPEQVVATGRIEFGPELAYRFDLPDWSIEPLLNLSGIWDFTAPSLQAQLQTGVSLTNANGTRFELTIDVGGLGIDQDSWGLNARVSVPLP